MSGLEVTALSVVALAVAYIVAFVAYTRGFYRGFIKGREQGIKWVPIKVDVRRPHKGGK